MNINIKAANRISKYPPSNKNLNQNTRSLLTNFWLLAILVILYFFYSLNTTSIYSILGAILIGSVALIPSYLWCSGQALGMPIFPLFALTYLWTHAVQLLSDNPGSIIYSPESQLLSSITVTIFLGLGTFIWFQFVKSAPPPPQYYRSFKGQEVEPFLLYSMVATILFNIGFLGGWLAAIDGGIISLFRGIVLGLNALATFVLAYRWGKRQLSKKKSQLFLILIITYTITNAASLLLVGALSTFLLATMAFIIGRRQVPWLPIAITLACILFLHYGKGDMRAKYWFSNQQTFVQPWEYPAWYIEWMDYSWQHFNQDLLPGNSKDSVKLQSPLERTSLIQLLLMIQERTPRDVPYLNGATYAIIPQLLVPRLLNPHKIASHEGTYLLNIHYGKQTRADTARTTIGFGLLNEAYANFGFLGCVVLAVILGGGYGQVTRWSINTPIFSFRSLFAMLLMPFTFQSEFSAGVYIAALFQSLVPLVVITIVFMKVYKLEQAK
ncbi:MAG TPA: hypothetical protein V6D28_18145 [Leptolyngbyaceae cyanobacterium]